MNREKLKKDIKNWVRTEKKFMRDLSQMMGFGKLYLANILAGTTAPTENFWFQLKETTGLEEDNYK